MSVVSFKAVPRHHAAT